jgi:hypothetical protein
LHRRHHLALNDSVSIPVRPARMRPWWLPAAVACWLLAAVGGLWVIWAYDNTPGIAAMSPERWPDGTRLQLARKGPTLVFLAHPQCSCTRASLGELAEALARAGTRPKTYVVFLKPSAFGDGWEKTGLWEAASSIPETTVVRDDDGREAARFGAATSGQTMLYDADGSLLFTGGITGARAHAGDNAGRRALVALLNELNPDRRTTTVFGCSLFGRRTRS